MLRSSPSLWQPRLPRRQSRSRKCPPQPPPRRTPAFRPTLSSAIILSLNVQNGANETVGQIKDLVLEKGRLVGYILSVGGFLGMGEHYVVVQPDSIGLTWDPAANKWKEMINATKDQLKAVPEFKYEGKVKAS